MSPEEQERLRREQQAARAQQQAQMSQGPEYPTGQVVSAVNQAGPWGWLALAIAANETTAKKQGRRPASEKQHFQDAVSGKVLEYDADALADKVDGTSSPLAEAIRFGGKAGNPEGLYEMGATGFKKLWELFS